MVEPTLGEYRLGKVEEGLADLVKKVDELPGKLAELYATKAEVKAIDDKVEEDREAAKTRKTGTRALYVGLAVAAFTVFLGAFIGFMSWIVQSINHVNGLGG